MLRAGGEKEAKKTRNCQVGEGGNRIVCEPIWALWEGDTKVELDIQEKYKGEGGRSR